MFGKTRMNRLAAGTIAVLGTAGALAFLGTGAAQATVANTPVAHAYSNVDHTGCQVVVGDEADNVHGSAIGEVDITRCSAYYPLAVRVYLDHQYHYSNGTVSSWQTVKEWLQPAGTYYYTYQLDVATPAACGYENAKYTDYWVTAANISFDGGRTWSGLLYSNYGYWETGC